MWFSKLRLHANRVHLWLRLQAIKIWKRRHDVAIALGLTAFSGLLLKGLVEVCGLAPTIAYFPRWILVTATGFFLYRAGVSHDGRLLKQLTMYSLRRVRKMFLSLAAFTALVHFGMYYIFAWAICTVVFGLYEFMSSKKSVYGEGGDAHA